MNILVERDSESLLYVDVGIKISRDPLDGKHHLQVIGAGTYILNKPRTPLQFEFMVLKGDVGLRYNEEASAWDMYELSDKQLNSPGALSTTEEEA